MSCYLRYYLPDGTYFFTVVTHYRRPFLTTDLAREHFRTAIREERLVRPFDIIAFVLLPDHLHTIWTLPQADADYPTRWKRVKERFTQSYLAAGGIEAGLSASRRKRKERGIWQRRFWEHTVRDEDDLKRCLDYIHYNPVKHRLVERVADYSWSTFHRWVRLGEYERSWGTTEVSDIPGAEWE